MGNKTQLTMFTKHDEDKAPLVHMLEVPRAMAGMCEVIAYGATKYEKNNWRKATSIEDQERCMSACLRHITSYHRGEFVDPDTGLHHLAHAITNLAFLIEVTHDTVPASS